QQLFLRAAEIDPMFAPAWAAMAVSYVTESGRYAPGPPQEAIRLADCWARRAVSINPRDAAGQAALAWTAVAAGKHDEALERVSPAIKINPNSVWAHFIKAAALLSKGLPSEAREASLAAFRLSPRDRLNTITLIQIGISYYFERDYPNALEVFKRIISRDP